MTFRFLKITRWLVLIWLVASNCKEYIPFNVEVCYKMPKLSVPISSKLSWQDTSEIIQAFFFVADEENGDSKWVASYNYKDAK